MRTKVGSLVRICYNGARWNGTEATRGPVVMVNRVGPEGVTCGKITAKKWSFVR